MSKFRIKFGIPYEERYRIWKLEEDAKSLEERLRDCKARIANAVEDFIIEVRNAPHTTLDIELKRARALYGLINHPNSHYQKILDSLPPVPPPTKTMEDYADDAVDSVCEKIDRMVMGNVCKKP